MKLALALKLLLITAGTEVLLLSQIGPLLRLIDDSGVVGSPAASGKLLGFLQESRLSVLVTVTLIVIARLLLKASAALAESDFRQSVSIRLSESYYLKILHSSAKADASTARVNLSNLRQVADLLFDPLLRIYAETVTALVLVGFLFYTSPTISSITVLLVSGVGVLAGPVVLKASSRLGKETRKFDVVTNRGFDEMMRFEIETTVFNLKTFFSSRFLQENRQLVRKRSRLHQMYVLVPAIVEFCGVSILLVVIGFSSYFLASGSEAISTVAVFVVVAIRLIPSAASLYSASIRLRFGVSQLPDYKAGAITEVDYTVDYMPVPEKYGMRNSETLEKLVLNNVAHRYSSDSPYLFSDLNLSVKVGEIVGIVGDSGVGKSTLGLIAVGAVIPTTGYVSMQALSGSAVLPRDVSRGYVPQFVPIISGSLRENISLGRLTQDHPDLDELITKVNLEHLDRRSTIEEDQLLAMSGGERQRIGIARALLGKPKLLVLDEVTSSLDSKSEEEVVRLIQQVSQNSSTLFITHRVALLASLTRSFVLRHGTLYPI